MIGEMERYSTLGAEKMGGKGVRACMGKALFHALFAFFWMYILRFGLLDG
jgi:hypothetical protein